MGIAKVATRNIHFSILYKIPKCKVTCHPYLIYYSPMIKLWWSYFLLMIKPKTNHYKMHEVINIVGYKQSFCEWKLTWLRMKSDLAANDNCMWCEWKPVSLCTGRCPLPDSKLCTCWGWTCFIFQLTVLSCTTSWHDEVFELKLFAFYLHCPNLSLSGHLHSSFHFSVCYTKGDGPNTCIWRRIRWIKIMTGLCE
jgi:hypothetical protein